MEPEVITACENVCRDFYWVGPLAGILADLAIVGGVIIALVQLNSWRFERRQIRRSEVAEHLISVALNTEDALRSVRSRFDPIPMERAGDKVYPYQKRFDRLLTYNDLFKSLRDAQIKVRAIIGDTEVDEAVEELFRARNAVIIAIETLADLSEDPPHPSDRVLKKDLRSDLYGSFDEDDELGQKILGSVGLIERKLQPVARLQ